MNTAQVLSIYSAVWASAQRMLEVARAEEWDVLIDLGQARDALMSQIMQAQPAPPTDPQQAAEMARLIRSILAADQQIQGLTRVWMDEINGVLGSVLTEKKLLKAYDTF